MEVVRRIKPGERQKITPVALISSKEVKYKIKSCETGVSRRIVKPVDFDKSVQGRVELGLCLLLMN